jgi:hypothetical protein
LVNKDVNT